MALMLSLIVSPRRHLTSILVPPGTLRACESVFRVRDCVLTYALKYPLVRISLQTMGQVQV